mmetsp:Transcript_15822/g.39845  ORF Transcript_15822/g.39845 Transcript_15822/m.39845 type:complete len:136 (+) Transcript_15822:42-449(+)
MTSPSKKKKVIPSLLQKENKTYLKIKYTNIPWIKSRKNYGYVENLSRIFWTSIENFELVFRFRENFLVFYKRILKMQYNELESSIGNLKSVEKSYKSEKGEVLDFLSKSEQEKIKKKIKKITETIKEKKRKTRLF